MNGLTEQQIHRKLEEKKREIRKEWDRHKKDMTLLSDVEFDADNGVEMLLHYLIKKRILE